jgi:hypothetical protein
MSRAAVALAAAGLLACGGARTSMLVAPSILPEVSERDATWRAQRPPLALSAGAASSCADYARLESSGIRDETPNMVTASQYRICDVLAQIGDDVAVKALTGGGSYGEALATRLDLRSFASSLGPRLEEDRYTLTRLFDPSQLDIKPHGVAVGTSDWSYVLRVVLVGDLDRDGSVDWIVWLDDEARQGSYRAYQTLVIRGASVAGPLQASEP